MTVFRTVVITLLLGVLAVRLLANPPTTGPSVEDSLTFLAIGGVYLLTLFNALWMRRREVGRGAAFLQIAADVLLATGLVYITGGAESPYTFTYLLAVLAGAILLYQRGAVVAAASSAIAFTFLALAIQSGVLAPPTGGARIQDARLAFAVVSNVLAQVLIAALATYLAHQLRSTGGRLSEREADLRQLAELQSKIFAAMPSGLITFDGAGRVTFVNRAATAILGLSSRGRTSRTIDDVLPGSRAIEPGRREELVVESPNGARVLGLTTTPLGREEGDLLVVFQDLTELRRMEAALERSDRLASLGTLSAQLAHEIRNPLAAMRGSAQLLADEAKTHAEPTQARLANILVREADRLSHLVTEFLQFARPNAPTLVQHSLDQLVRETIEILRSDPMARDVRILLELSPVTLQIDPDLIRQVLLNLLRNAFAAAQRGEVRLRLSHSGTSVRLAVWDSAGAIAPEHLPRIFEPFFTTRPGGTGLGLSTAYSIVRAHQGTIEVNSARESGTEFVIELPAEEGARASAGS